MPYYYRLGGAHTVHVLDVLEQRTKALSTAEKCVLCYHISKMPDVKWFKFMYLTVVINANVEAEM